MKNNNINAYKFIFIFSMFAVFDWMKIKQILCLKGKSTGRSIYYILRSISEERIKKRNIIKCFIKSYLKKRVFSLKIKYLKHITYKKIHYFS